jgi:rod shape-determining protein MreC
VALSRRTSRSRFTLVLLVLTSLTLLTLDFRGFGPIDQARNAMLSALAPVGHGAQAVFRPVGNLWDGAFKYDDLKKRDKALQTQVDELKSQIATGQLAEQSNQQLLEQADLPFVGNLRTVRAAVVSGAIANFNDTIQISKGSRAGIRKDMPVVVGTGLVGIVVQVASDRSVVKLVTDTTFAVGVSVLGSDAGGSPGVEGVANGQGSDTQMSATVDTGGKVARGDILITRGESGSPYPAGLPVGTVASVSSDVDALHQSLVVDILADVRDLSYVSVVIWPTGAS